MHAELIVTKGSNRDRRFVVRPGQRFEIGRGEVSVLLEDDAAVSRKHARIELRADGRLFLADLNSRNGTFLAGQRLRPHLPTEIPTGARIDIGEQVLRVVLEVTDEEDTRRTVNRSQSRSAPVTSAEIEYLGVLGKGAHATVYAAYQRLMDRRIAVKVLRPSGGPEEHERFLQEGRLACRVRSPHVVEVYDFRIVDDQIFMFMELIDGLTLRDRLKTPLSIPEALKIAEDVARGLASIHAEGIIHRDIKPSNVLLAPGGRALLSDFGIAKDVQSPSITPVDVGFGTLPFVAPEQAASAATVDSRADIYSLGATIYFMITGQAPFKGLDVLELVERTYDPPPVAELNPNCPESVSCLIQSMLSRDPAARPASAEAVARQLEEARMLHYPIARPDVQRRAERITQTHRLNALRLPPKAKEATSGTEPGDRPGTSRRWGDAQRSETPKAPVA